MSAREFGFFALGTYVGAMLMAAAVIYAATEQERTKAMLERIAAWYASRMR